MSSTGSKFSDFTRLPNNISNYGSTLDEVKSQQGTKRTWAKNLNESPYASSAQVNKALRLLGLLPQRELSAPEFASNPYEGPTQHFLLLEKALKKLRLQTLDALEKEIEAMENLPYSAERKANLRRVKELSQRLKQIQSWTRSIYHKRLSSANDKEFGLSV